MPKFTGDIQVDETMWSHSPINFESMNIFTKHQRQLWIFGMIQKDGEIVKLFNVTNRTTATLKKLIQENVEKGSVVHHDGWAAYLGIPWAALKIKNKRHVKKTVTNEEVRTFAESNLIEGLWGNLKFYIKHSYNTLHGDEGSFYDFIQEALWRR